MINVANKLRPFGVGGLSPVVEETKILGGSCIIGGEMIPIGTSIGTSKGTHLTARDCNIALADNYNIARCVVLVGPPDLRRVLRIVTRVNVSVSRVSGCSG